MNYGALVFSSIQDPSYSTRWKFRPCYNVSKPEDGISTYIIKRQISRFNIIEVVSDTKNPSLRYNLTRGPLFAVVPLIHSSSLLEGGLL